MPLKAVPFHRRTNVVALTRSQCTDREHSAGAEYPGREQLPDVLDRPRAQKKDPAKTSMLAWGSSVRVVDSGCRVEHGQFALALGPEPRTPVSLRAGPTNRPRRGHPSQARMPIVVSASTVRPGAHAVITSSSARRLIVVSSNERCTWLLRVVYRRP